MLKWLGIYEYSELFRFNVSSVFFFKKVSGILGKEHILNIF